MGCSQWLICRKFLDRRRGSAYIALLAEIRMCFAPMIMYTYEDMSPGQGWK